MKRAEYKLPFGVHPLLEPREVGREPDRKSKDGTVIPGKPIYDYYIVTTPESENLDDLRAQVDAGTDENIRVLGQGALDIIRQRKIREWASGDEAAALLDGKDERTAGMTEEERVAFTLGLAQEVGDAYVYGARQVSAGGAQTKAAKEALATQQQLKKAAEEHPEVAKRLAQLQKQLADLGYAVNVAA